MALKTGSETSGCSFQWKLENIIHCWSKAEENIKSPSFYANDIENTTWSLELKFHENFIIGYLRRAKDCDGPSEIEVKVVLSFLVKESCSLTSKTYEHAFPKGFCGQPLIAYQNEVFVSDTKTFLPADTLTMQCEIWKKGKAHLKTNNIFGRTVWKVNRRNFVWKIDKFTTIQPGVKGTFKDDLLEIFIFLKEGLGVERNIIIDVLSMKESIEYVSFKTAIISSEKKKICYGSHTYFKNDLKKEILTTLISSGMLMENKDLYLPNDVLSLDCEFVYSTGTISDQFCSSIPIIFPKITEVDADEIKDIDKQANIPSIPVLINDFKSIFNDGYLSDIDIRTSTKTYPVHKSILGARSPVFRRMFSNNMKEKVSGFVIITDLEHVTVYQMLLYIYTDTLEDLQFENACKLYEAADKYEILSLRNRCSSFLKAHLSHNKALDVLVLADRHQDEDLKSHVENFILSSDKELFGSHEWKRFMTTNLQLAADIMRRKIFPG